MGELVVGEAGFFGAEEDGYVLRGRREVLRGRREVLRGRRELDWWGVEGVEDEGRYLLKWEDGLFDFALADGGGGDDEGAVGDGGGEGVVAAGVLHYFAGGYCCPVFKLQPF